MADSATIIGENTRVVGSLAGDEDLNVFGTVEGTIRLTEALLVENSGVVRADVSVRSAVVSGVVIGNIVASDAVELTKGGRMVGDITAPRIIIADGAAFRGHVEMSDVELDGMSVSESSSRTSRGSSRPAARRTAAPIRSRSTPSTASAPRKAPTKPRVETPAATKEAAPAASVKAETVEETPAPAEKAEVTVSAPAKKAPQTKAKPAPKKRSTRRKKTAES